MAPRMLIVKKNSADFENTHQKSHRGEHDAPPLAQQRPRPLQLVPAALSRPPPRPGLQDCLGERWNRSAAQWRGAEGQ